METENKCCVTAESLIIKFGDQAYHEGLKMALDTLRSGEWLSCVAITKANIELIRRGYDTKPSTDELSRA